MQIVYLSDRPQILQETWDHVRHFMPWIERAVVVTPARRAEQFRSDDRVHLAFDEELTGLTSARLRDLDHVRRNVTLRKALLETEIVDDLFVLSDDDYRPIRPISPEFFHADGIDIGYYSYDLGHWPGDETDFDHAQHVTREALSYLGYPTLGYGAHMPQLMRREWWTEAFGEFHTVTDDVLVCEWALYFNVAAVRHPDRLAPARPFETMCWPQFGAEWPWWVRPARYSFENFYPELYEPEALFAGLPRRLDPAQAAKDNFEKILRWTRFARGARRLDFPSTVDNPWTSPSAGRAAAFGLLRKARGAYRYLAAEDRALLTELAGRVEALGRTERSRAESVSRQRTSEPSADE
ncbi:MAG TPA: hypothetical protein PKA24_13490 [Microthrixaceae bacterium]|jgi:hypothetical protein|nr:hypothetical protein [Microthrixaceae bacterium]HMT61871.1 hypothetical protein [Microthrixaceae bacterium]